MIVKDLDLIKFSPGYEIAATTRIMQNLSAYRKSVGRAIGVARDAVKKATAKAQQPSLATRVLAPSYSPWLIGGGIAVVGGVPMLAGQGTNFFGQSMRFQKTLDRANVYFSPIQLEARLLFPATRARVQKLIREKLESQGLGQVATGDSLERMVQDTQKLLIPTTAPEQVQYETPQPGAAIPPEEKKKLQGWLLPAGAIAAAAALLATS